MPRWPQGGVLFLLKQHDLLQIFGRDEPLFDQPLPQTKIVFHLLFESVQLLALSLQLSTPPRFPAS
jgi:hypothetical protein